MKYLVWIALFSACADSSMYTTDLPRHDAFVYTDTSTDILRPDRTRRDMMLVDSKRPDSHQDLLRVDQYIPSPDQAVPKPDQTVTKPDQMVTKPDQMVVKPDTTPKPDQLIPKPDQTVMKPDQSVGCTQPTPTVSCRQLWIPATGGNGEYMCTVKAGCYMMGGLYPVTLTHDFEIGKAETTGKAWDVFSPYKAGISGYQVTNITAIEAATYCNQLSKYYSLEQCYACTDQVTCTPKKSPYLCKGYRLPTEAEWEYAYRAGTTTPLYNGALTDANADKIAWYQGNNPYSSGLTYNQPGCMKSPNGWGLCDMAGSMWEWVYDKLTLTGPIIDPVGTMGSAGRSRGGASNSPLAKISATSVGDASWVVPRNFAVGFRCARTL